MEEFKLGEYIFEWDEQKNELNFRKHKIYFEDAVQVFFDDNRIEDFDKSNSDDEDRFKVTGLVDKVLVVIYTERAENHRIISARYATKKTAIKSQEEI